LKRTAISALIGLTVFALAATPVSALTINELRVDHGGADVDEYVELHGAPGPLTGVWLIVIGDTGATNTCGIVEQAIDLSPYFVQPDGFFALRISTGAPFLTGYDATVSGSLENSDNLTFLLVTQNTATVGMDLDSSPEDGIIDVQPWANILDSVALFEGIPVNCTTEEHTYSPAVVGPDGTFSPVHIYWCGDGWHIGPFGTGTWPTPDRKDTPGEPNDCTVAVQSSTWGAVKHVYR